MAAGSTSSFCTSVGGQVGGELGGAGLAQAWRWRWCRQWGWG